MSDKSLRAFASLMEIATGAGLLLADRVGRKRTPEQAKEEPAPRKFKPKRPGDPAGSEVEVEEIKRGEYLPKPPPVRTEADFSADAWAKVRLSQQRRINGWN